MTTSQLLKDTSCRIACGITKGSAFFISGDILLTANHVLVKYHSHGDAINLFTHTGKASVGTLVAFDDDCDLALIRVPEDFVSTQWLNLCECEMIEGVDWSSYGYPDNTNGQTAGEPLKGTIKNVIQSPILQHDVTVEIPGYNVTTVEFEGFSGSPLVDAYCNVISVMRFSGTNDLSAVSIKRGCAFLKNNDIILKPDYLLKFDQYELDSFGGFSSGIKSLCEGEAEQVAQTTAPGELVTAYGSGLFFPEKKMSPESIIAHLRTNPEKNKRLWTGWLEFLTFVAILKGQCLHPAITVDIPAEKILGLLTKKVALKLQLNYFWTEKESLEDIARRYIHNKLAADITHNSCHIFNSELHHFGIKLRPDFKKRIIENIGNPANSGLTVLRKVDFGVLSLKELADEVGQSATLPEAFHKLTILFRDAIEQN